MDLHEGRHPARGTGKKQASRTLLARFLLFVTAVLWGWTFVATKVCLAYMSPIELMGLRFLIALPVLLALVLLRGISLRFPGHRRGLLLGAAVFAAHFFLQITALKYTTATNTGWIIAVTPLVIALLAFESPSAATRSSVLEWPRRASCCWCRRGVSGSSGGSPRWETGWYS
ncbi:MAG: DMT family transporter [Acidobacteriota bacterium]